MQLRYLKFNNIDAFRDIVRHVRHPRGCLYVEGAMSRMVQAPPTGSARNSWVVQVPFDFVRINSEYIALTCRDEVQAANVW